MAGEAGGSAAAPLAGRRVAVVVLGDFGRSPRMQNHAISLASTAGAEVEVIAYEGCKPKREVLDNPRIRLHLVAPPWTDRLPRLLRLAAIPYKLAFQVVALLVRLLTLPRPDVILLQNPPTIPTFSVVQLARWLRGCSVLLDWHNYGFSLLALSWGKGKPIVRLAEMYERWLGGCIADAHLCVSEAMRDDLRANWGISAHVLYDQPPASFRRLKLAERHQVLLKLQPLLSPPAASPPSSRPGRRRSRDFVEAMFAAAGSAPGSPGSAVEETVATRCQRDMFPPKVSLRRDRPAIVVSSTSWTADEDMNMLLEAAVVYDGRVAMSRGAMAALRPTASQQQEMRELGVTHPNLLIIVTGVGPLRAAFEERLRRVRLRSVAFRLLWLEAEDYPRLLGAADLGVSLHASSSGVDLPMKVVDMLGCGLPVCALAYPCIGELVKKDLNGVVFSSGGALGQALFDLLEDFNGCAAPVDRLRANVAAMGGARWEAEWEATALPVLQALCGDGVKRV